jgi:HK97 family phage major capsid protein
VHDDEFAELRTTTRNLWGTRPLEAVLERRADLAGRQEQLTGYANRSYPQEREFDQNAAEIIFLDEIAGEKQVEARQSVIARGMAAMANPGNLEGPDSGSRPGGAPALVKGLGDRRETPAEVIQRAGNPWRDQDSGPLSRTETGAGMVARAHTALEALEGQLTRDGCQKLAEAMAEEVSWPGVMIKRSKDEAARAAELWLALSNPFYAEAFRSVLRYPGEFTGVGATGFETLTDDQRQAWRDVRTNELCRAAFGEATGAAGAFAIPLDLHPDIILTNAGSANPFRRLCRNVVATTNISEFITSAGSTANWLAEGTAVADTTPTLGQLAVTHFKESVWIFGSFEVLQDTALGTQVPALIADAKDRLEVAAFALGTGSGQPFGMLVHGTSDSTATALTALLVYALHQALPPRFRVGDNARPVWMCNVAIINALRQLPTFSGSVTALLNDNQPGDNPPQMLGVNVWECSAMASAQTTGLKTLAILDANSYIITNRQPEMLLYEPLFKDQATGRPAGQAGWFSWSRTGADLTTATACQYHTN